MDLPSSSMGSSSPKVPLGVLKKLIIVSHGPIGQIDKRCELQDCQPVVYSLLGIRQKLQAKQSKVEATSFHHHLHK
jgi:hypothetical protein